MKTHRKKYFYLLKTEILEKYQDYYDFGKFSIDEIFIFAATWEKPTFLDTFLRSKMDFFDENQNYLK